MRLFASLLSLLLLCSVAEAVPHAERPKGVAGWVYKQEVGARYALRNDSARRRTAGRAALFVANIGVGAAIGTALVAHGMPAIPAGLVSGGLPTPILYGAQRWLSVRAPRYFAAPKAMTGKQLAVETAWSSLSGLAGGAIGAKVDSLLPASGQQTARSMARIGMRSALRGVGTGGVRAVRWVSNQVLSQKATDLIDAARGKVERLVLRAAEVP